MKQVRLGRAAVVVESFVEKEQAERCHSMVPMAHSDSGINWN
jgi:hypothetical protein